MWIVTSADNVGGRGVVEGFGGCKGRPWHYETFRAGCFLLKELFGDDEAEGEGSEFRGRFNGA
jgi:hypothetical protein